MTTSMASSVAGSAAGSTRRGVTSGDGSTGDAERPGREPGPFEHSRLTPRVNYLTSTEAPASVSLALAASAASMVAFSRTGLGAPSTRSLASFRPRLVSSRTTLMTWIFWAPASGRMTSNSSFSSSTGAAAAAPPPAGRAARPTRAAGTATGAAAVTPNFSSNASSSSLSSITVIPEMASRTSSLVSVAMGILSPYEICLYEIGVVVSGNGSGRCLFLIDECLEAVGEVAWQCLQQASGLDQRGLEGAGEHRQQHLTAPHKRQSSRVF